MDIYMYVYRVRQELNPSLTPAFESNLERNPEVETAHPYLVPIKTLSLGINATNIYLHACILVQNGFGGGGA